MSKVWLAVGTPENWQTAFEHGNTWGLKASQSSLWTALTEGDLVLFYATRPVGGVIGYGSIHTKLRQNSRLWPQELRENRVIWPLRFAIQVTHLLPQDQWSTNRVTTPRLRSVVRSGFQILDPDLAQEVIAAFAGSLSGQFPDITVPQVTGREAVVTYTSNTSRIPAGLSPHDTTKLQLVEIGRMQHMIAESEIDIDGTRLDVVWRRTERASPMYAFEVQVGGDIYHALVKLKQAVHLWNSRSYLVAAPDDDGKYHSLVSTAFHEVRERMTFIPLPKVVELYQSKLQFKELEREIGIP